MTDQPPGLARLVYQDGELLDASDFTTEQQYFSDLIQSHTRSYFTAGVASNLGITLQAGPDNRWTATIQAGVAVDAIGRHLVLTAPFPAILPRLGDLLAPPQVTTGSGSTDTAAELPAELSLALAYQTIQTTIIIGGQPHLRLIDAPLVLWSAPITVGGVTATYYAGADGRSLPTVPSASVRLALITTTDGTPKVTPDSAQVSQLRQSAGGSGDSTAPAALAQLTGSGALVGGVATIALGEARWASIRQQATVAPQVWPLLASPLPDPPRASRVAATSIDDSGSFQVVALDDTDPGQAFAWAIPLTS